MTCTSKLAPCRYNQLILFIYMYCLYDEFISRVTEGRAVPFFDLDTRKNE